MDRDATFLLSLATFAVAALAVGTCGWIIWSRGRAARSDPSNDHPPVAEES
jgi:microcompartment protein CcmK/EutM